MRTFHLTVDVFVDADSEEAARARFLSFFPEEDDVDEDISCEILDCEETDTVKL